MSTERSRTFEWVDPSVFREPLRDLPGLEFLQKFVSGELPAPPINSMMNFSIAEVSEGRVVFVFEPAEYHYSPLGNVHGGVFATVLDTVMGCAIHSVLPRGSGYTTLEIKVNFIRPLTAATGPVRGEGTVVHAGKRTATAEGRIVDQSGKLYAHATTTCLVLQQ